MKFSCIIVDDEPIAHEVLKDHISKTNLLLPNSFFNAQEAKLFLKTNSTDILFLDIKMPGISGMDFLDSLPVKPITIITTGFRQYALEGFDLGVIDYLLKPISFGRFSQSINKAIEFITLKKNAAQLTEQKGNFFTIKSGTKIISLELDSITHIQGLKDYTIFYVNQKKYVVKGYIKTIAAILPDEKFTRVHKSFIVANNKIKYVNRNQIEFDQFQIPVGRSYKERVREVVGIVRN